MSRDVEVDVEKGKTECVCVTQKPNVRAINTRDKHELI